MSKVLVDRDHISALVQRLALEMQGSRPIVLLPIMTGALCFCADLLRALPEKASVKPIVASREGVQYMPRLRESDRHCDLWVVDNTICAGLTLRAALAVLPPGTRSVVLFGLPCEQRVATPSLVGIELQSPFVAGYGADVSERQRGLCDLWTLRDA